jgi:arginyl-tRNA synthetase
MQVTAMNMKMRLAALIGETIAKAFPQAAGLPPDQTGLPEVPPDPALGDYAYPCFRLSKALRMSPPAIAAKLADAFSYPEIATAQCAGGYLNFFLNRENFARDLLGAMMEAPEKWGSSAEGAGKTVCLDYSSINIAKRFHIGHLSTTMIGHSLKRIYSFLGWNTVGINHLGDWGTQFGKMITAYLHWGSQEAVETGGVQALVDLYVRFHAEAEKDPALEDEGRAWFKKIEDGDPEALAIFGRFKDLTMRDVRKVYSLLNVSFDSFAGESFYNDKMGRVVDELRDKNLLRESDGAYIVDLEPWSMPPCLILKRDGATLYATRDIAAALYRKDTYHFDKCLYIVAYQQDLHFRQWFKVLELMGYEWAKTQLEHVAFGMVSYEGQTLSTRTGYVVYLEDLLERAQEKAMSIIMEKSPNFENKEEAARQVGIGAVVYADLQNSRIKDIDFWWDRAMNFDGETGPYVQYTHARCCAVLRKLAAPQAVSGGEGPDVDVAALPDYSALADDESQSVLRLLSRFPDAVADAAQKNEPFLVTRATTDIAKAYNKFYYERRILDEDKGITAARICLTDAVRAVIKTGLYLTGIDAPERM